MHFNRKCDEEYFKQLSAEKQITKFNKGFPTKVWVKVRPRNEALDCEVYAVAAFTILTPDLPKVAENMKKKIDEHTEELPKPIQTPSPTVTRRTQVGTPRIKRFRGPSSWVIQI